MACLCVCVWGGMCLLVRLCICMFVNKDNTFAFEGTTFCLFLSPLSHTQTDTNIKTHSPSLQRLMPCSTESLVCCLTENNIHLLCLRTLFNCLCVLLQHGHECFVVLLCLFICFLPVFLHQHWVGGISWAVNPWNTYKLSTRRHALVWAAWTAHLHLVSRFNGLKTLCNTMTLCVSLLLLLHTTGLGVAVLIWVCHEYFHS